MNARVTDQLFDVAFDLLCHTALAHERRLLKYLNSGESQHLEDIVAHALQRAFEPAPRRFRPSYVPNAVAVLFPQILHSTEPPLRMFRRLLNTARIAHGREMKGRRESDEHVRLFLVQPPDGPEQALARQEQHDAEARRLVIEAAGDADADRHKRDFMLALPTSEEREAATCLIGKGKLSDREISRRTGVGRRRISELRRQIEEIGDRCRIVPSAESVADAAVPDEPEFRAPDGRAGDPGANSDNFFSDADSGEERSLDEVLSASTGGSGLDAVLGNNSLWCPSRSVVLQLQEGDKEARKHPRISRSRRPAAASATPEEVAEVRAAVTATDARALEIPSCRSWRKPTPRHVVDARNGKLKRVSRARRKQGANR